MEPNDPHQQQHFTSYFSTTTTTGITPTTTTTTTSPTNGLLPPHNQQQQTSATTTTTSDPPPPTGSHVVYPHSMGPSTASVMTAGGAPVEATKRKRGRPRKYGTPEQALAAKKTASSNSKEKRDLQQQQQASAAAGSSSTTSSFSGSSSKKPQHLASFGNAGHGFTPHVIAVAAGEDVTQKVMQFLQQSTREMCILSASGSISSASLRQPATSGGNIAYEGRFEIISLCGSYVRTDIGGRAGGLSVCLSDTNGQIIGGGVGGPLKAAGPVQVIVGTFVLENKKDSGVKGDASASKLPSPIGGASVPSFGFRSPVEYSVRNPVRGHDDHQTIGGNLFTIPPTSMHVLPPRSMDWRTTAGYELTGRTEHGGHQSPENGDYE